MNINFLNLGIFTITSLLIYGLFLGVVKKEISYWTNKKIAKKICKPMVPWIGFCIVFSITYFILYEFNFFFKDTKINTLVAIESFFLCFWISSHIALSQIDFFLKLLPYRLTIPFVFVGLTFNGIYGSIGFINSALSGIISFILIYGISKVIEFFKNNKSAPIGFGDLIYISSIGVWVGFYNLMYILFVASSSMVIIFIFFCKIFNWKRDSPLPFGPSLSISSLFFGLFSFFKSGEVII